MLSGWVYGVNSNFPLPMGVHSRLRFVNPELLPKFGHSPFAVWLADLATTKPCPKLSDVSEHEMKRIAFNWNAT
jgi:hypothetical protein